MAPKKFNYLFAAAAALILLGAAWIPLQAEARRFVGVNRFCHTASYRRICTQMVNGASDWRDASNNAMLATLDLARRLKDLVPILKPALSHLDPATVEEIMKTCDNDFYNVVDDLEVSLQAFKTNDIGAVAAHLSAALRTDCQEAMKAAGPEFPLNKYAGHLTRRVDNCLAVILQN
ncbi:hypothetical protein ABFS83_05G019600 [Erythranthe nasuta]